MHPKHAATATAEQCLREILDVLTCMRNGHFTARLYENMPGTAGETAKVVNETLDLLAAFRSEHLRVTEEVGVTGRLGGQMEIPDCTGAWREMADATNRMAANITCQYRDGCNVTRARLAGQKSHRMTATNIAGEFREFREQFNAVLDAEDIRLPVAN